MFLQTLDVCVCVCVRVCARARARMCTQIDLNSHPKIEEIYQAVNNE